MAGSAALGREGLVMRDEQPSGARSQMALSNPKERDGSLFLLGGGEIKDLLYDFFLPSPEDIFLLLLERKGEKKRGRETSM